MNNKGYLLVMMETPAHFEDEFNAWYDTEHVPERVAVPGFETGRRFVCIDGAPRFLAMYDMESPAVLESPGYLKVSFGSASPWTRRVTSRVKVDRSAGAQIYPGGVLTGRPARVVLLRFRALDERAADAIVAGMRANFERRPQTVSVRVLSNVTADGIDYFGFVEARAPLDTALDLAAFGRCADAIDLVNTYAAY